MSKHNPGWVYVEHSIDYPDERGTIFRSYIDNGENTHAVEDAAKADAIAHHPNGEVEFFMSRRVTEEKAAKIMRAMRNGTWAEWFTLGRHQQEAFNND